MAADNKLYVSSDNTPIKSFKVAGVDAIDICAVIPITNGDGAGSIYRIANIPANYIPVWGEINCEAITSLTDADLGLYENDEHGGAVIDKDIFADGVDLSSALLPGSGHVAIKSLPVLSIGKTLAEIASHGLAERQTYCLALTSNSAPGATKVAVVRMRFINAA